MAILIAGLLFLTLSGVSFLFRLHSLRQTNATSRSIGHDNVRCNTFLTA